MIIKFAIRNLLRLPWRTVLYFFIVLLVVLSVTTSVFICGACRNAERALDESYIFVASLVARDAHSVTLADMELCLRDADISAYNVTMTEAEGCIPGGDSMLCLPDKENKREPTPIFLEKFGCRLAAVENLSLAYPFFSGECSLREGRGLSGQGYSGAVAEAVIPWWLAEENGISVGDTIVRRYYHNSLYTYMECTVVGIYESSRHAPEKEQYPTYIPLAIAERDYDKLLNTPVQTITIERADFILSDRDAFVPFIKNAADHGLDIKRVDLVFNNSIYDVLSTELDNIHTIALFVMWTVFVIGVGILLFFTVYLIHSRRQERMLLRSLGMTQRSVVAMIAWEHIIVFVFAVCLGIGGGRIVADGVCSYVNDTVLERASASEEIRISDSSSDFDPTMPLERNMKIEISVSQTEIAHLELEINDCREPGENEFGVSRHTYYAIGESLAAMFETEWTPVDVIGITEPRAIKTSVSYEQIRAQPNYRDTWIYAFVSENSPYLPDPDKGRTILYVTGDGQGSYVRMSHQQLSGEGGISTTYLVIVGTYEENPYCSGEDILILMDDYHRLYSEFSIMDENFYFERIGAIYERGALDVDS